MDINELPFQGTIGQARELSKMFGGQPQKAATPSFEGPVVAQFIERFVFVCHLDIRDGWCYLTHVRNVRYWETRNNGLGGLAVDGQIKGDKVDGWPDQAIPVDKLGPVMYAPGWA